MSDLCKDYNQPLMTTYETDVIGDRILGELGFRVCYHLVIFQYRCSVNDKSTKVKCNIWIEHRHICPTWLEYLERKKLFIRLHTCIHPILTTLPNQYSHYCNNHILCMPWSMCHGCPLWASKPQNPWHCKRHAPPTDPHRTTIHPKRWVRAERR